MRATPRYSGLRRNNETGRSNGCHLFSYEGMKSRSCGLVRRIGAADSATPHPDPSGGQAPALHFLIPPSTIGLQFGTFRRRRAGMEGDWRAHPGSESGTCFRANRSCRLAPAHQGMKIGCIGWWESSSVIATTRTSPLDSRLRGNDELGAGMTRSRNGGVQRRARRRRRRILVPMTRVGIYSRTNDTHETGPPKSEQLQVAEIDLTMEQSMLCSKNNRINPRDREQR